MIEQPIQDTHSLSFARLAKYVPKLADLQQDSSLNELSAICKLDHPQ